MEAFLLCENTGAPKTDSSGKNFVAVDGGRDKVRAGRVASMVDDLFPRVINMTTWRRGIW